MTVIYLDNHATTATDPRVAETMAPWLTERFGNPSSKAHRFGRDADNAVTKARAAIARTFGARSDQIVLTSGATESINLAIRGIVAADPHGRNHVIALATEHKAVLDSCEVLTKTGGSCTIVPVGSDGIVDLSTFKNALTDNTVMACTMAVNNEIGVVQPLAELGRICAERGVHFFVDAAQAPGRMHIDVEKMAISAMSITAHKCYGPKGAGCLFIRRKEIPVEPLIVGGGQEFGLRSGTLATHQIVGLAAALQLCDEQFDEQSRRIRSLRDRLLAKLRAGIEDLRVNGSLEHRVAGNLNVAIPCADSNTLMMSLPDLAISSGSACSTGATKASHVLTAIGTPAELAHCSLRFGIGRFNSENDIDIAAARVIEEVTKMREHSPLWQMRKAGVQTSW